MEFKQENDDKQVKLDQALAEIDTLQEKLDLSEKREEGLQAQIRGKIFPIFLQLSNFYFFINILDFWFFFQLLISFKFSLFFLYQQFLELQMTTTEEKNELLRKHEDEKNELDKKRQEQANKLLDEKKELAHELDYVKGELKGSEEKISELNARLEKMKEEWERESADGRAKKEATRGSTSFHFFFFPSRDPNFICFQPHETYY